MGTKAAGLITVIALSAVSYSTWIIYQVIQQNGYSPEVASGIATLGLVTVTIWYAWSTGKLTNLTREQIKATKAAYAPNLNASVNFQEEKLEVELQNTGKGPVKSITIDFDVVDSRTRYRYRANINSDIGPGSSIRTLGDENVVLTPKFKVTQVEESQSTWSKFKSFISGDFGNPIQTVSKTMKYDDLVRELRITNDNPEEIYLPVHLTIRYTDILQEKQYTKEKLQGHRASISRDSLSDSISDAYGTMHLLMSYPETRREYLRDALLGDKEKPTNERTYEEVIETESKQLHQ